MSDSKTRLIHEIPYVKPGFIHNQSALQPDNSNPTRALIRTSPVHLVHYVNKTYYDITGGITRTC